MCFILIGIRANTTYPFVIAANRDEFHHRATEAAGFWPDHPALCAGRDLEAGGSWMGITRSGRFAALTNFSETQSILNPRSRGQLVTDYLLGSAPAEQFIADQQPGFDSFGGFNLLVGDWSSGIHWISNRHPTSKTLETGVFALSNHFLDTPWSKITNGKQAFSTILESDFSTKALFDLLHHDSPAQDLKTDDDPVTAQVQRIRSSIFVKSPDYGTRSSTVITISHDQQVKFIEHSFDIDGKCQNVVNVEFELQ